jgi:anti-sigma factor RsiW
MIGRLLERRRYMREHRWTHAHLSDYLDGELGADQRKRVDAHVAICPNCTRVLGTLRWMLEGLHRLRAQPETAVSASVIERLRHEG